MFATFFAMLCCAVLCCTIILYFTKVYYEYHFIPYGTLYIFSLIPAPESDALSRTPRALSLEPRTKNLLADCQKGYSRVTVFQQGVVCTTALLSATLLLLLIVEP